MNPLDIELYKVFAKKELVEGCYTIEKDGTMWHCGNGEWKKCWNKKGDWGLSSHYGEHMGEILGVEPRLEDVFQKAKEKEWYLEIICISTIGIDYVLHGNEGERSFSYPYNPFITLLEQSDGLKEIITKLFK